LDIRGLLASGVAIWQGTREGPMKRHNFRRHVAMGIILTAISGATLANSARGAGMPAPQGSVFTVDNESGTARTIISTSCTRPTARRRGDGSWVRVLLAIVGSVLGIVEGAFQTPIRRSLALFYVHERSVHVRNESLSTFYRHSCRRMGRHPGFPRNDIGR
jgi:hypothetical protein